MKKDWESLTQSEQQEYIQKAKFLIERGYVLDKTEEELAKQIYEKVD